MSRPPGHGCRPPPEPGHGYRPPDSAAITEYAIAGARGVIGAESAVVDRERAAVNNAATTTPLVAGAVAINNAVGQGESPVANNAAAVAVCGSHVVANGAIGDLQRS